MAQAWVTMSIRVSPEVFARVKRAAEISGVSPSRYAADVVEGATKDIIGASKPLKTKAA